MDEFKIAWAAGIMDGEGCVGVRWNKKRKSFTLVVSVTNTDPRMLITLKRMFGGSIQLAHSKNYKPHYKTTWGWFLVSTGACAMLQTVLPHLVVKRDQAELAITFQGMHRKRGGAIGKAIEGNAELLEKQAWLSRRLSDMKHEIPAMKEVL